MIVSHDLFAEINPAFGAFTVLSFCRSFHQASETSPAVGLLYLAVPIAMSADTQYSFAKTNAKTRLLSWLNRYPDIRLDLGARLDASLPIVTASLKLALEARALILDDGGSLQEGSDAPGASHVKRLPDGPKDAVRRAERLGTWMALAGSVGTIYSAFGVIP